MLYLRSEHRSGHRVSGVSTSAPKMRRRQRRQRLMNAKGVPLLSVRNMVTVLQFLSTIMVMMRRCSVAAVAMDDGPMSRHLRANARKPQPDSGSITHPEQTQSISGDDANKRHHQEKLSTSSLDTLNGRHRRAIVGGTAADPHRFPSVVFLSDREDELSCGGTLISPTLVLTAAHCEISLVIDVVIARDSSDNVTQLQQPDFLLDSSNSQHTDTPATPPSYNHQRVRVKQELKHPLYDASTLRYDIMLLQLEHAPIFGEDENSETSRMTFPFMRLDTGDSLLAIESNETTPLPEASRAVQIGDDHPQNRTFSEELNDDVLLALGWGHTQYSRVGIGHPSDYLQQAGLGLVPNQECSQAQEGLWLTYNDRISEEMLCTFAASRDACYGDSGGPIILPGKSPEEDVQVGIISWGEDCADPVFPGVATRVSFGYSWIRRWVCALDGNDEDTPEYFECDEAATFSPAPTPVPSSPLMPSLSPAPTILLGSLIVNIHFDVFADEIAWAIQDFDTGETVAQRTYGFYEHENEVREVVMVRPGHVYTFTIKDVYGDGITDNGYYQIFAFDGVDESNTDGMIVSATRFTGREQQRTFLAPYPLSNENLATSRRDTTEPPSDVPSATPSTNPSDMPSAGPSIELSFGNDGFSNDIGRLCIANGHFCRDNESCCSSICYSGLCLKNPNSRHDQHIHQNEGNQGG